MNQNTIKYSILSKQTLGFNMKLQVGQTLPKSDEFLNVRYISYLYDYGEYYVWKKYHVTDLPLLLAVWVQYIHDIEYNMQTFDPNTPFERINYHNKKYINSYEVALIIDNQLVVVNPYGEIKSISDDLTGFCQPMKLDMHDMIAYEIDSESIYDR